MHWGNLKRVFVSGTAAAVLSITVPGAAQAVVSTSGCAGGSSCTLTELFGGGSISIDNFTFDNWSLDINDTEFNPANVTVSGIDTAPTGNPNESTVGLSFVFDPALVPNPFVEVDFDFDASASGAGVFTDIMLDLISFNAPGGSILEVNSNLIGPGGSVNTQFPNPGNTSDSQALGSITGFTQDTDIQQEADPTTPSLSQFDFTYTVLNAETPPPPNDLPEPASLALLGFGLAGLAFAARRRRTA